MRALQIVGRKKSGKTRLIELLIPLLQRRGLHVATVKHSSHPHPLDREGADSWRHRAAGSEATLAITAAAVSLHIPVPQDPAEVAALVERHLGGFDLVLIEGWAEHRGPKIEVLPADPQGRPREPRFAAGGDLIAVVLAEGLRAPVEEMAALRLTVPWYYWTSIAELVDLIAEAHPPA